MQERARTLLDAVIDLQVTCAHSKKKKDKEIQVTFSKWDFENDTKTVCKRFWGKSSVNPDINYIYLADFPLVWCLG